MNFKEIRTKELFEQEGSSRLGPLVLVMEGLLKADLKPPYLKYM